jgi:hypothetical protein
LNKGFWGIIGGFGVGIPLDIGQMKKVGNGWRKWGKGDTNCRRRVQKQMLRFLWASGRFVDRRSRPSDWLGRGFFPLLQKMGENGWRERISQFPPFQCHWVLGVANRRREGGGHGWNGQGPAAKLKRAMDVPFSVVVSFKWYHPPGK